MTKRLISFLIALCIFIAIPLSARYKYNPFTRKLDYYETGADIDLGDLADVTLTGLATGNVLYYDGSAWVNLATGANTQFLTLAAGIPAWQAIPAGVTTFVGLNDTPNNYAGSNSYMVRVNAGASALVFGAESAIDHDGLTNWAANKHIDHTAVSVLSGGLITGGGTIDGNQTLTLTEATIEAAIDSLPNLTQMQTPWTDVFVVATSGGDYTTIQAALNAQNSGGETFLVAPGTYTDTISFTASDQTVKALGHVSNVTVTQADANIVDAGAFTDCMIENIEIRLTAPTTAINAIQVGTGSLILMECRGYLATAVALAQADQPALVGFTDAGVIRIKRGKYEYYHTGNTGGGGIKAAFRANFNLAEFHLHKIDVVIITNSGTALVTSIASSIGTAITQMHNCIDIVVTDPNATNVIGLGYHGGAGAHNIQGNHVDVVATANTSYGIYHGGTGIVRSSFNALHAQDTGGTSYAFHVGGGATLNSHFDDLRSDDGNSITGTFVQVSSPADGDLGITDELDVLGVSEFSGDTNQYEDVFITWADAADKMVIVQTALTGTEDVPLIFIDDDRTGDTATELSEATIYLDAAGVYAFYIANGDFRVEDILEYDYTTNHNLIYGYLAGGSLTGGANNTLIGEEAGAALTNDGNAVFVGYQAGGTITDGSLGNVAVGYKALYGSSPTEDTTQNVAVGQEALAVIGADSEQNVAIGMRALFSLVGSSANENVAVGAYAAQNVAGGTQNVFLGAQSAGGGGAGTNPQVNVVVGYRAAYAITDGDNNAIFGAYAAEDLTTGLRNVVIGYMAGEGWLDDENDLLVIDNTDTATPLIYGDFAARSLIHNSEHRVTAYNRYDYISWNDCFDRGLLAGKYDSDWNLTALNTGGSGTNTIDTTPGHITLTTDSSGANDAEGTRSDFRIINRARKPRSEFSVDLGQTANTRFYCGWNNHATNSMEAAEPYAIAYFDKAGSDYWRIRVSDAIDEEIFTSDVLADTNTIIHEIWSETDGTIHWAINGTEYDITGSITVKVTAADMYLIVGQAMSVAAISPIVAEIDFVEVEKIKVH